MQFSFCGEKKESYTKYLYEEISWDDSFYIDPDMTHKDGRNSRFYIWLESYLNKMEKIYLGSKWSYEVIGRTKGNEEPSGIKVMEGNDTIMYLRSDQLGFSAPQGKDFKRWDSRYPYGAYMNLGGDIQFLVNVLWKTRSRGGSFLWPLCRVGRMWKSFYNTLRGVRTYIEDRADLTLWEIRKFYEIWESLGGNEYCPNTCLSIKKKMRSIGGILLSGPDYELICRWLMHFDTFEMFVEFFCFRDSFLENDEIINLINGKSLSEEYVNKKMKREEKRINDIDNKEELKEILLRIQNQIVKRTNNMLEKMTTMGE